jgi:hypothetical protein
MIMETQIADLAIIGAGKFDSLIPKKSFTLYVCSPGAFAANDN